MPSLDPFFNDMITVKIQLLINSHYETVTFSRLDRLNIVTSAIKPNTANKIKAKWLVPVNAVTAEMTSGGKKPPRPPIMDTIPFATPASFVK